MKTVTGAVYVPLDITKCEALKCFAFFPFPECISNPVHEQDSALRNLNNRFADASTVNHGILAHIVRRLSGLGFFVEREYVANEVVDKRRSLSLNSQA